MMACKSIHKMLEDIDCEGVHYTFNHYDYYEINNEKFMIAYKNYLEACKELQSTIEKEFGVIISL